MLNISHNSINDRVNYNKFDSIKLLRKTRIRRIYLALSVLIGVTVFIAMFLPWTQNISAMGYVTSVLPNQRPQGVQSAISGQIVKWNVREGDMVEAGDTIVQIKEIKNEYFDPKLIERTEQQASAKSEKIIAYRNKIDALNNQLVALKESLGLKEKQTKNKIEQTKNKIRIDSVDLVAILANLEITKNQESRTKQLFENGLKTLTELQEKELKVQTMLAKANSQINKLENSRNELKFSLLELDAVRADYTNKLAKTNSELESARSEMFENIAATAKLDNQVANYIVRSEKYFITAPQSGFVSKTTKKGIGEIVKEGGEIATIVPREADLAVELYIKPQDVPLLRDSTRAAIRFDGWPALVISGWPKSSTGVFLGVVLTIDRTISENGLYRILVIPDKSNRLWPKDLRIGTGARSFILLNDVPIWYELWRQLNGFPPDFYYGEKSNNKIKRKAPLKSIK